MVHRLPLESDISSELVFDILHEDDDGGGDGFAIDRHNYESHRAMAKRKAAATSCKHLTGNRIG